MEIRLLESAKEDLRDGGNFYEGQTIGLGDYFLDSVEADIRALRQHPGVHVTRYGFHWFPAKRFPFAVYYLVEDDCVDIHAALDCRRGPKWTSRRLSK